MQFAILGPVEARTNGSALQLGGPKPRALLAMLLLDANEPVSRDRLIEGLWGDDPPPSADQTLDSYVSRLRRVLGPDRVVRRPPGYLLVVEPGELDLERFERLVEGGSLHEALGLWRGPALADVLYEPFAGEEAERLEERRLVALEDRIEADLAAGEGARARAGARGADAGAPVPRAPDSPSACSRSTAPAARPTRSPPCARRGSGSTTSSGWRRARGCASSSSRSSTRTRGSTRPGPPPRPAGRARAARPLALAALALAAVAGAARCSWPAATRSGARRARGTIARSRSTRAAAARPPPPSSPAPRPPRSPRPGRCGSRTPRTSSSSGSTRDSGQIEDRIAMPGQPGSLAAAGGAVWVAGPLSGSVTRIDPASGRVTQTVRVGSGEPRRDRLARRRGARRRLGQPRAGHARRAHRRRQARHTLALRPTALAVAAGDVWVASYDDGVVAHIDPATGQTLRTVRVGGGPSALTVAGGVLWSANSARRDGLAGRPAGRRLTGTVAVGSGPAAFAADGDGLWVVSQYAGRVARIDTATIRVTRTIRVGGQPGAVAVAGGRVWVAAGPSPTAHRGGTLRMVTSQPLHDDRPRPAVHGLAAAARAPHHDSLVSFQVSAGPAGLRLVPDLAVALPRAAAGRARVHVPAAARDRLLRRAPAAGDRLPARDRAPVPDPLVRRRLLRGVVGAGRCREQPRDCRLARHRGRRPRRHGDVPAARAGPGLPVQADGLRLRGAGAARGAGPRRRRDAGAGHRALPRRELRAPPRRPLRPQPALPRVVARRPAGRQPRRHRAARGRRLRRRRARGRARRGGLAVRRDPAGAGRVIAARAPRAGAREPRVRVRLHPAQHARAALRRRPRPARAQLRDRPRQGRPHVRARRGDAALPGAAARAARPPPVLPLSARPREGAGARGGVGHARAAGRGARPDRRGVPPARAARLRGVGAALARLPRAPCTARRAASSRPPCAAASSSPPTATGCSTTRRRPRTCRSSSAVMAA